MNPFRNGYFPLSALLFLLSLLFYGYTGERATLILVFVTFSNLLFTVLKKFAHLCDDTREIRDVMRQKNPPNQAPEPTPTTVTPPAEQEARQP